MNRSRRPNDETHIRCPATYFAHSSYVPSFHRRVRSLTNIYLAHHRQRHLVIRTICGNQIPVQYSGRVSKYCRCSWRYPVNCSGGCPSSFMDPIGPAASSPALASAPFELSNPTQGRSPPQHQPCLAQTRYPRFLYRYSFRHLSGTSAGLNKFVTRIRF